MDRKKTGRTTTSNKSAEPEREWIFKNVLPLLNVRKEETKSDDGEPKEDRLSQMGSIWYVSRVFSHKMLSERERCSSFEYADRKLRLKMQTVISQLPFLINPKKKKGREDFFLSFFLSFLHRAFRDPSTYTY